MVRYFEYSKKSGELGKGSNDPIKAVPSIFCYKYRECLERGYMGFSRWRGAQSAMSMARDVAQVHRYGCLDRTLEAFQ